MNRQSIRLWSGFSILCKHSECVRRTHRFGFGYRFGFGCRYVCVRLKAGAEVRPSQIADGKASYYDTWMHGLAAPWGWGGQYFQVVVDFASDTTFNTVVAWWHRGAARCAQFC